MLLRVFSLTFNSVMGGFDDSGVRDFLRDKELISVRDHLFVRNEIPYLTLVVKYFPFRAEADPSPNRGFLSGSPPKRDESWKSLLAESDMGLFNLMRDWRSKRSKTDGVPTYVVLTNQELAHIVKVKPQSLADLGRIEGVGKAKIERYGSEILGFTRVLEAPVEVSPMPQATKES
jgi:superfamily II DNA helicase RecQ